MFLETKELLVRESKWEEVYHVICDEHLDHMGRYSTVLGMDYNS